MPACTRIVASSTNFMRIAYKKPRCRGVFRESLANGPYLRAGRGQCPAHCHSVGNDAHELPVFRAFALELHLAVSFCEQGMISAYADVGTRVKPRSALTNDNIAREHGLTAIDLDAQAFTFGIAAVLAAAACFLVCHKSVPSLITAYSSAAFLSAVFFAAVFFAATFLAGAFLAAAFLVDVFLATFFLAAVFLAGAFFAVFFAAFFAAGLSAAFSSVFGAAFFAPLPLMAVISISV